MAQLGRSFPGQYRAQAQQVPNVPITAAPQTGTGTTAALTVAPPNQFAPQSGSRSRAFPGQYASSAAWNPAAIIATPAPQTFIAQSQAGTRTTAALSVAVSLAGSSRAGTRTAATLANALPLAAMSLSGSQTTAILFILIAGGQAVSKSGTRTTATIHVAVPLATGSRAGTRTAATLGNAIPLSAASRTGTRTAATPAISATLATASPSGTQTTARLSVAVPLAARSNAGSRSTATLSVRISLGGTSRTGTRTAGSIASHQSLSATSRTGSRTRASLTLGGPLASASLGGTRTTASLMVALPLHAASNTGTATSARLDNGFVVALESTSFSGTHTGAAPTAVRQVAKVVLTVQPVFEVYMVTPSDLTVGDLAEIAAAFTVTATGEPINPTSVTFYVRKPSGGVLTADGSSTETGVFTTQVPVDEAGEWRSRAVGTGAAQAVSDPDDGSFRVKAPAF